MTKIDSMQKDVEHRIIDAARILFYEKGYEATTVRDIAGKAGVNLALLHYYFKTKDKIFQIVLEDAFTLLFKRLGKAFSHPGDLFEKIEKIAESYISTALKYPQMPSFIIHEFATHPGIVQSVIGDRNDKDAINTGYRLFFEEVERAVAGGVIREVDPRELCMDILSLSLFPFVGKNFISGVLFTTQKEYKELLKRRVSHVATVITGSIKL